jgi:hypothetical protein
MDTTHGVPRVLIKEIRTTLKTYGDLANQHSRFMGLDQPDSDDYAEMLEWAARAHVLHQGWRHESDTNDTKPYQWAYQRDDLVTLAANTGATHIENFVFHLAQVFSNRFVKVL